MTVEAMVLSLYMLFPIISVQQQQLHDHYLETNATDRSMIEDDNGAGLVAVLDEWKYFRQNELLNTEEESIAIENLELLENPELGPQSAGSALAMGLEEENYAEIVYKNSLNRLAFFNYGEEFFTPSRPLDGSNSIVNVNSSIIVRNIYDEQYRLTEKITWKNASTVKDSEMLSKVTYYYGSDDSSFPTRERKELYDKKIVNIIRYSKTGKVLQFEKYSKASAKAKEVLEQKIVYEYDSKGRVTKEETSDLLKDEGRFLNKKREYRYLRETVKPNVWYYEEGKLRLLTEYGENDDSYVETVFFDGGFSIKSEFKDGVKVNETIYHEGIEYGGMLNE
ncbi:MAG: hypothetical protein J6W60_09910 [Treponema sp.]|nr:hypothetical protein [Treponema sp.]MBP5753154.1 hypothetical protein [Treponema sp.]